MNRTITHPVITTCHIALTILLLIAAARPEAWATTSSTASHNKAISDSLGNVLRGTTNSRERIALLYDIFDLAPMSEVNDAGERILAESLEAKDYESALDILRRLGSFNISRDTARITRYCEQLRQIPESTERTATECFLYMCEVSARTQALSDRERYEKIISLLHNYNLVSNKKTSVTDRFMLLFAICKYMQLPGESSTDYIAELRDLAKKLPFNLDGIDNMIYLNSAIIYTDNYQPARAVAADRELLRIIDRLDNYAHNHGHRYRNYDRFRYTVYRRMLCNAEAMSDYEIEKAHQAIAELRQRNKLVDEDMKRNPHSEAYYLMAKQRYPQALELLMQCLENDAPGTTRNRVLRMAVKAASEAGDNKAFLKIAPEYIAALENGSRKTISTRAEEFKALLDAAKISEQGSITDNLISHEESDNSRLIFMIIAGVMIAMLIAGAAAFYKLYNQWHKMTIKYRETKDMLIAERDNLKNTQTSLTQARDQSQKADRNKSEFIYDMCHEVSTPLDAIVECSHIIIDSISGEKRKYLEQFANTLDINADMLRTIVNDMLEINDIESGRMTVQRSTVSIHELCSAAVQSMRRYARPGVELRWLNEDEPPQTIFTDPRRVEQVLINLLSNGLKFTEKGFVELSYEVDTDNGTTRFIVTDSGLGIPPGKEELIFKRFEKMSRTTQGSGLGLSISRMIAQLLKGRLYVDTTYKADGSRFIFIIPSVP